MVERGALTEVLCFWSIFEIIDSFESMIDKCISLDSGVEIKIKII